MKTTAIGFILMITSLMSNAVFGLVPCEEDDLAFLPGKLIGLTSMNGQAIRIEVTTPDPSKVDGCFFFDTAAGHKIHYVFADRFEAEVKVSVANPLSFHPTRRVFKMKYLVVEPAINGDEVGRFNRMVTIYDPSLKISYLMFLDSDGQVALVRAKLTNV